jgi:hypothetical protein
MLFTTRTLLHKNYIWALRERRFFSRYRPVADDEPIPLTAVLAVNGIYDALWCLRATTAPCDQLARLLAADFAEHVLHLFEMAYPDDPAPRRAIEVARRFATGRATDDKRRAAAEAAAFAAAAAKAAAKAAEAADDDAAAKVPHIADTAARAAYDALLDVATDAVYAAAYDACFTAEAAPFAPALAAGAPKEPEPRWQAKKFRAALAAHIDDDTSPS